MAFHSYTNTSYFSFLLVREPKWNRTHRPDCPLLTSNTVSAPQMDPTDWYSHLRYGWPVHTFDTCVRCLNNHYASRAPLWQRDEPPRRTWTNPWRSSWAPPVTNEFMCSNCWDRDFRTNPHPNPLQDQDEGWMRCLCPRREELQVLLVCRRWYEEAGRVFWSENVFSFEEPRISIDFVENLRYSSRDLISKISISTRHFQNVEGVGTACASRKLRKRMWAALRSLPALTHLELDGLMLAHPRTVGEMTRLGLTNLRSVRFVLHNRPNYFVSLEGQTSAFISPETAESRILVGGLAEEVAGAIKGQRRPWLKVKGAIETAVELEQEALRRYLTAKDADDDFEGITLRMDQARSNPRLRFHYNDSISRWKSIWDRFARKSEVVHAYLPASQTKPEVFHEWQMLDGWQEWFEMAEK